MILSEYDFNIEHIKGKMNPADFLSWNLPPWTPEDGNEDNDQHDLFAIECAFGGMDFPLNLAIKYYLESQSYPEGATEEDCKQLRIRAAGYFVQEGDLFWYCCHAPTGSLQVLHECNAMSKIQEDHEEFHDGVDNTLHHVLQRYTGPYLCHVTQCVI